jgi:Tol biopolymer transport system component
VRIEPGQPFPSRLSESGGMERSNDQISKAKNNSKERNSEMTTQAKRLGKRRSAAIASLVLGATLAGVVALAGPAQQAEAAFTEKVVFSSNRTTGVDNPTGDLEIFKMNPDGTGVRQLTFNKAEDFAPILSPDGSRITYETEGRQISNPEGDWEVYVMNASDGKGKKNLSDNGADVYDYYPDFSPGSKRIAYQSYGVQGSNKEGDYEVYVVNAIDGTGNKNLTNNGVEVGGANPVDDYHPDFSPDGKKIAYQSYGKQTSNPEGDDEVYRMNSLDGSGKRNLSNSLDGIDDAFPEFSPDGTRIAYESIGKQNSNDEGDTEVYSMSALDGLGKKNLTNNGASVNDYYPVFSPGGKRIAYQSEGVQDSNKEGDYEVYRLNSLDGTGQKNLTNNGGGVVDFLFPGFSSDGTRIFYETKGAQGSNLQGDDEVYRLNTSDGLGKKNLTDNAVFDGAYPD